MNACFRTALLTVAACLLVASYSITGPTEQIQETPNRPAGAPPLTGWNIDVVDILESGRCHAVEKWGDLVYASFAATLSIFDISNPSSVVKIGHTQLSDLCWDMERSGNYLYCMLYPIRLLEIVDVSDPTRPYVVASIPADGGSLAIEGQYLYHEHTDDSLRILDISTPTAPVRVGAVRTWLTTDIAARYGYVYAADAYSGLRIIDATNPRNPVQVALHLEGAHGVEISGSLAYVSNWISEGPGFFVVDVSDPQNPVTTGYVPGSYVDIEVEGSYAYLLHRDAALHVFDITDPTDPVLVGSCDVCWFSDVNALSVSGGIAVVASDDHAMCVLDVSNPLSPVSLDYYEALPYVYSVDIADGHLALTITYGGLLMVNRYETNRRYWMPGSHYGVYPRNVVVRGDYAYIGNCDSWYQEESGLAVVDVSDPTSPAEIGYLPVSTCVENLSVGSSHVYFVDWNGIVVADISDPTHPTTVGQLACYGVSDVFAEEPYLYVAKEYGLRVVDVSDPTTPTFVGNAFSFNGSAWDVCVADGYAYLAGFDYDHAIGLWILDVTDPLNASLVATVAMDGDAYHVLVRDSYLYLQSDDLLQILDVSDPTNPIEVGNIATSLENQIAMAPPYIYGIQSVYGGGSGAVLKLETELMTAVLHGPVPSFLLKQNYPNPFSSTTTIDFVVQHDGLIELAVFDVQGKLVATLLRNNLPAGPRSVTWDGRNEHGKRVGSGIYFCRLRSNESMHVKKMVVAR